METQRPPTLTIPISCCPKKAPCPTCGKLGRRKDVLNRLIRSIAYHQVVYLDVTYGEYRARCHCCSTFRTMPTSVEFKARYDNKVRQAVLDRILEDGMSVERVIQSIHRDFLLDLSDGFVYDCLLHQAKRLDMAEHRRWVLEHFRGTLCVDELHLGRYALLLATDPLNDLAVAFALVASNDKDHMRRFLKNLKTWGLEPEVVVTDGSDLYPAVLAELWPSARHQLCVFHVLKDLHKLVLDALRRFRRGLERRGNRGRKRRRGRPSGGRKPRHRSTYKEKSAFIFSHRFLIVRRRDQMSRQERIDLNTMLNDLPELRPLRQFVDALQRLFAENQGEATAWRRHQRLTTDRDFLAVPELVKAVKKLGPEKFAKMIAFLGSAACRQMRTNNHVERINRKLRHEEKARYKWRSRRTIVRFMVLLLDRYWEHEKAARSRWLDETPPIELARESPKTVPRPRVA